MLQLGFPAFLSLVGIAYIAVFQDLTPAPSLGLWTSAKMYMDWLHRLCKTIWDCICFKSEVIPSVEALKHHWMRSCHVQYTCGHRHRTTTLCYFHCMKINGLWAKRESETEFHYSWRVAQADQAVKLNDVDVDRRGLHVALGVTVLLVIKYTEQPSKSWVCRNYSRHEANIGLQHSTWRAQRVCRWNPFLHYTLFLYRKVRTGILEQHVELPERRCLEHIDFDALLTGLWSLYAIGQNYCTHTDDLSP